MSVANSTTTKTVTVNAAFLQEIKEVNQELWETFGTVQHMCSRPISVRGQCRQFVDLLGQLRDQLALHFALEEAYGYFEDPVFVAPHLGELANSLRAEHKSLYLQVCNLVDRAEQFNYGGRMASLVTQISQEFEDFYDMLQQHEARENDLILQAYDEDIGVGD